MMKGLLLATLLFHVTYSTVHHVIPDDEYNPCNGTTRTSTLQHYLNNTKRYVKSHTEWWFKQGHHFLCKDWMLKNVSNFTIKGNNSTLSCIKPSLGIAIVNVTSITIMNLHIKHCSKIYNITQRHKSRHMLLLRKATLFINFSADVIITNVCITINNYHTSGIIGINVVITSTQNLSTHFANITVLVMCENTAGNSVSGIILYYNDNRRKPCAYKTIVTIQQYIYKTHGLCNDSFALRLIMMQRNYHVKIEVKDTKFTDLINSSALLYYAESCRKASKQTLLIFSNCKINNNKGNEFISMLLIEIHSHENIFDNTNNIIIDFVKLKPSCSKLANHITFINCDFVNNIKMNSLIYILLKDNEQLNAVVLISESNFCFNNELQFINTDSELKLLKALSYTIIISATKILSNSCSAKDRISLITMTSGIITFNNSVIANNNNFENIVLLYSSLLQYKEVIIFSGNCVRYILKGREGSFYIYTEFSRVQITENLIYSVADSSQPYTKYSKEICVDQFISKQKNYLDYKFKNGAKLNFTVALTDNIYTMPKYEINFLQNETYRENCIWLANTAFQTVVSKKVFQAIFKIKRKYANKTDIGKVPSSICPCSSIDDYNCSKHEIGSIFSGQKLTIKLIIPTVSRIDTESSHTTVLAKTYNTSKLGCHIINAYEISQIHLSHECNEYNYTIWFDGNSSECELYLGAEGAPEIFYVNLMPCPVGFSLQKSKKGCYCDEALNTEVIKINSCNLEDETIQRPANSWISGRVTNDLNAYMVCTNCPFDYCLPHSSHFNLSNSDLQCQFGRSGLLCGQCPKGLSTVFGSSDCEKCSNVTLLVIIPIAVAGILLVLMLFILNLTVTNGTINTFIFYFNIVSINISMFVPMCHDSIACITLSLFNLDLGIKSCFYDGMDDYAKTWLQLVFPVFLIFIALVLIIGSRHSKIVQRLTAKRGLPVLATLFLLSYTKVLLTICHAMFFYSTIIHLPSKRSALVWSVDTNIPLFGIKFSILFATCLLLFLILIPFNILLLFTRSLMRFRFISTFKPLLDAYFAPYKDKFYYWTGLQLLLRAIFLGLSTLDTDVNLSGGIILLGILLCIQGVVHPFKSWLKNVQESVVLLDLLALYVTALYNDSKSKEKLPVAWYLLFPVLAYFVIVIFIICHCIMSVCGNTINQKGYYIISAIKSKLFNQKGSCELYDLEKLRKKIPDVAHDYKEFQEPLVALDN